MGARFSYSSLSPEDQAHVPSFYAVGLLESEVGELHELYSRWLDTSPIPNVLSLDEMMRKLHSKVTPFTRKIFDVEDVNAVTTHIPFYKFVLGLWSFCTLDEFDLVLYIFNMYDSDNEGVIDVVTCKMVIRQLYGDTSIQDVSPGAESCIRQLTESRSSTEYIDIPFLVKFSRNCSEFLHPALVLKTILIEVTMGVKFWGKKLQDRKEANNYAFVSKELLIKRAQRRNMDEDKDKVSHPPPPPPPGLSVQTSVPATTHSPTPTHSHSHLPLASLFKGARGGGGGGGKHIAFKQSTSLGSGSDQHQQHQQQQQQQRWGGGSSSFSGEDGRGSIMDQISSLFGRRGTKPPPPPPPDHQPPPPSQAAKRAKKQKPIYITRVSTRTLTYGGGASSVKQTKPSTKRPAQIRKIHVYGFYNKDGGEREG